MGANRLSALAINHTHCGKKVGLDNVAVTFARKYQRRIESFQCELTDMYLRYNIF